MSFCLPTQFDHGQSNPTYYVNISDGTQDKKLVVRKKPPGKLVRKREIGRGRDSVCLCVCVCVCVCVSV